MGWPIGEIGEVRCEYCVKKPFRAIDRSDSLGDSASPREPAYPFVRELSVDGAVRLGIGRLGSALEQAAAQALLERGPARVAAGVVADLAGEGVDLGVEVVEVVKRDRLERHRQLRAAELVRAVWLTIMCLSRSSSSGGNGSPVRSAVRSTLSRSISTPMTRWPTSWPSSV